MQWRVRNRRVGIVIATEERHWTVGRSATNPRFFCVFPGTRFCLHGADGRQIKCFVECETAWNFCWFLNAPREPWDTPLPVQRSEWRKQRVTRKQIIIKKLIDRFRETAKEQK